MLFKDKEEYNRYSKLNDEEKMMFRLKRIEEFSKIFDLNLKNPNEQYEE